MCKSPEIEWFISAMNILHIDLRKYKNKVSHLRVFTPVDFSGFIFIRIICHKKKKHGLFLYANQGMYYDNIFFVFTWQQITARSFKNTLTCNNAHKTRSLHWQKKQAVFKQWDHWMKKKSLQLFGTETVAEVLKNGHLISQIAGIDIVTPIQKTVSFVQHKTFSNVILLFKMVQLSVS